MERMESKTTDRVGNWIQVFSGRPFWPLDPRPDEIDIHDIARSLSMRCRYGGHVKHFYSVAEHSVHVSRAVPPEFALWGLLHDAAEAYSADIPRPLKKCLPDWPAMEQKIMDAIAAHFDLPGEEPPAVKAVDFNICADEIAVLLKPWWLEWDEMPQAIGINIPCWSPRMAEWEFLNRFQQITGQKLNPQSMKGNNHAP